MVDPDGVDLVPGAEGTGDQIHPVRVHHGHQADGAVFIEHLTGNTENTASFGDGLGQIFGKFQQHRGGNPLVGMVGGGENHPPVPLADAHGGDRTAIGGVGQNPGLNKGIGLGQIPKHLLAEGRRHGAVNRNDRQKNHLPTWYAGRCVCVRYTSFS